MKALTKDNKMKITICDPCKSAGQTIQTSKYMSVKGLPNLRLDVCAKHNEEAEKMTMVDYVRFVYASHGMKLTETDEEIKEKFLRR